MLRRLAFGISLAALLAAAPAAQAASTLTVAAGKATWKTTSSLDQTVEVGGLSGGFSIRVSSDSTVVSGAGCTPSGSVATDGLIACDSTVTSLDVVFAGGDDTLQQASSPATIPIAATSGAGRDNLEGGSGGDTLDGGAGTDIITGGAGNDTIIGGFDHDTVDGGTNTKTGDTFSYDDGRAGPVTVTLTASTTPNDGSTSADGTLEDLDNFENVAGGRGADDLTGSTGANRISGGDGDDDIRGDAGDDDVRGDDGNDKLDGGAGADVMRGGDGTDAVTYELRTTGVTVNIGQAGADDGNASDGPAGARDNIVAGECEVVIGSGGDDTLSAGVASIGRRLEGRAGNDTLNGGTTAGADVLIGGSGIDTLNGNGGDDTLEGDSGSDSMDGGTGTDRATYVDHDSGVSVTLGDGVRNEGNAAEDGGVRDRLTNVENVSGSPQSDTLFGDDNQNDIDGGSGNDVIRGGATFSSDRLDGGPGIDTMDYGDRTGAIRASLDGVSTNDGAPNSSERDVLSAFEGLTGGLGGDTLSATIAATINGAGGDDAITGSGAADVLDGGSGSDTINGGAGVDTIRGGDDDDSIDARDSGLDSVDCGNGAADNALTDSIDTRANCELGAPPAATPTPTPSPTPTPTPKPKKPLKTFAVTVFFHFPDDPTSVTLFDTFTISNVPKGAKVVGNCVTRRGKSCKGSLKSKFTLKQKKRRTIKAKKFTQKRYPAGSKLEVVVSKKGFKNQIKTVTIRNGKQPGLTTRCQKPGAKKRTQC